MRAFLFVIVSLVATTNGLAQSINLLGHLYYEDGLNDIWGYTDTSGVEYALVGVNTGVSIVDITTDSLNPVELFKVPGPNSSWGDIKTWDGFAYAVNEKDSGLLIIDLRHLPDSIHYQRYQFQVDTLLYKSAHNIWIDENGVAYLFGTNLEQRGTYFLDLTDTNRYEPPLIGKFLDYYIHDGFVRGDTLWGSHITQGFQSAIDISDKQNPLVLGTVTTPNAFAHNCWVSNDGQTVFTTDERPGAFVTAYDASDVTDMAELDRFRANATSEVIPHNVYWKDDYLFISYYRDGLVLVDAKHPHNLIETGRFDSSPFPSGPGFQGNWGTYPYFPSGKLVISDREEGLFVLRPHLQRAAYLEGTVTDSLTGDPLIGVQIDIPLTPALEHTNLLGRYATGMADPGVYNVRFSMPGCITQYVSVELFRDSIVTVDRSLSCIPSVGIAGHEGIDFNIGQQGRTLRIQTTAQTGLHVELINLSGQRVWQTEPLQWGTQTVQIPRDVASGMYLLRMAGSQLSAIEKIVIP